MNGTHLRTRIGCDGGRVERRILDGVTHAEDVVVTHRLYIE
jgi:hypothetical protein